MSSKKRADREMRFKQFGENFRAKLIGIDTVEEARGDNMCQAAMSKLKAIVKAAGEHKQQIIINVSLEGVKIIDLKSLTNLHTHEVVKISFISRDPTDKRAFGYVYGDAGNHKFFAIKTQNQADELVLALKDLFEIVLANKQKEVEEQKKRMEETTVYLKPSYDNPIGSPTSKQPAENIYSESPTAAGDAATDEAITASAASETKADPPLASLVSLEDQVSSLQMGITAMENLDLGDAEPDPFSPGAVSPPAPASDPFAPFSSEPPQQPPPPLRPPQAAPRAAPRTIPSPVAEPQVAAQPASTNLFGEAQGPAPVEKQGKPSEDLFKEFKDTFTAPPQPTPAPSANPFGGAAMGGAGATMGGAGGFGMGQPMMGGYQQTPSFGQVAMGGVAPMGMGNPMGVGRPPMGGATNPMVMQQPQPQQQQQQDIFGGGVPASSNSFDAFTLQPQQLHPPLDKDGQPKRSDPFGDIGLLGGAPSDSKDPKKKDPFAGFKMAKPGEVKVPAFGQPAAAPATNSNGVSSGKSPPTSLDLAKTHDLADDFSLPSPQGPPPPLPAALLTGLSPVEDDVGAIPPPPPRRPLRTNALTPPQPSLTRNHASTPSNLASLAANATNSQTELHSSHSSSTGDLASQDEGWGAVTEGGVDRAWPVPAATGGAQTLALTNSAPTDSSLCERLSSPHHHHLSPVTGSSMPISKRLADRYGGPDALSSSAPPSDSFLTHRHAHGAMTTSSSNPTLSKLTLPILPITEDPFADDPFLRGSPTVKKVFVLPGTVGSESSDDFTTSPSVSQPASSSSSSSPSASLPSTLTSRTRPSAPQSHTGSNGSNCVISTPRTDPFSLGDFGGQTAAPKPAANKPLFDDSPFGTFDFANPDKN